MFYFIYLWSIILGFVSVLLPNFFIVIFYKFFLKENSAKKILCFLYCSELFKITLFIVLCIFIFKYATIIKSLYFVSVFFIQVVCFFILFKITHK